jgi:hypothetical protein
MTLDSETRTKSFSPTRMTPPTRMPMTLVTALAVLALLDSLFNYVWQGNGIHGTEGALLVVISTFLMAVAGWIVAARWTHGWINLVLEILIFLDLLGTGAAAYFLNTWILLALDALALIAFLFHVFWRPAPAVATTG